MNSESKWWHFQSLVSQTNGWFFSKKVVLSVHLPGIGTGACEWAESLLGRSVSSSRLGSLTWYCLLSPKRPWQWLKTLLAGKVRMVEVLLASSWWLETSMLQKTATPLPPPPWTVIWLKILVVGLVRNAGLAWRLKRRDSVLEATGLEKWP